MNNSQRGAGMLVWVVVLALVAGGAYFLLGSGGGTEDAMMEGDKMMEEDKMMEGDHEGDAMMEGEDAMMMKEGVIEVEGGGFYYDPNVIEATVGEPITVKLNSVDMQHDFVIDELNVQSEVIPGGSSTEVTFTPTEAGEYEFYCSVGNHRAQGMVGTLVVTE